MVPLLSPVQQRPYRYKNVLLELPRSNGISPLGIGLDETNELCACFAYDVPSGTIVEQLDGDFLPCCPNDMDLHHPFQYPDMNLNVTLDVTTSGGSLLRFFTKTQALSYQKDSKTSANTHAVL